MRLLLVEDEVDIATAVRDGLVHEGYGVDVVHDGLDGLWRAREATYDALILDLMLPGMSGLELCRTLRAEQIWTPVLVLTVRGGEHDEASTLDSGADDFLSKPFSFAVLLARLRALRRRGAAQRPAQFCVGNLTLDPATRRCTRGAVDIALSRREWALLEALMARAGQAVSKQQLVELVWGFDYEGGAAIVEVYIGYLREKIDRPYGTTTIRTIRGYGYLVSADA